MPAARRPSVSYNDAKRTIPIREKQQKHSRSLAKTMKRINQTNSSSEKECVRDESRSGVKSAQEKEDRRREAIGFEIRCPVKHGSKCKWKTQAIYKLKDFLSCRLNETIKTQLNTLFFATNLAESCAPTGVIRTCKHARIKTKHTRTELHIVSARCRRRREEDDSYDLQSEETSEEHIHCSRGKDDHSGRNRVFVMSFKRNSQRNKKRSLPELQSPSRQITVHHHGPGCSAGQVWPSGQKMFGAVAFTVLDVRSWIGLHWTGGPSITSFLHCTMASFMMSLRRMAPCFTCSCGSQSPSWGSCEVEKWLLLARQKRNMWPMQTMQPIELFMRRERRRLKAKHLCVFFFQLFFSCIAVLVRDIVGQQLE